MNILLPLAGIFPKGAELAQGLSVANLCYKLYCHRHDINVRNPIASVHVHLSNIHTKVLLFCIQDGSKYLDLITFEITLCKCTSSCGQLICQG